MYPRPTIYKMKGFYVFLGCLSLVSAKVISVDNGDDSYSVAKSVLSLLSSGAGWTSDESDSENPPSVREYGYPPSSSHPDGNPDGSYGAININPGSFLAPHLEILNLIESFIKLKGEVASRLQAMFYDNYDLVMGIFRVLIAKIGYLHSFSLTGITVLRKIVEFALQCMGQWEVTVPSISFGGSHQSSGSL